MPIASSSYAVGHAQADGRKYVVETHALSFGGPLRVEYLAAVGADYASIMSARVPSLNLQLEDQELQGIVDGLLSAAAPHEMSKARLAERLRDLIRSLTGLQLCTLSARVLALIDSGEMTDAEFRTAFGLNTPQWNNAKTQMGAWRDSLSAVNAAESNF